jgi:hypothetical protein
LVLSGNRSIVTACMYVLIQVCITIMNVLHKMLQEGKITREQMEYFLKRMAEEDEKKQSQSSTDLMVNGE